MLQNTTEEAYAGFPLPPGSQTGDDMSANEQ